MIRIAYGALYRCRWCGLCLRLAVQRDRNVVLYFDGQPRWASNTWTNELRDYELIMQPDCNLVLYAPPVIQTLPGGGSSGFTLGTSSTGSKPAVAVWATGTWTQAAYAPCRLIVRDDAKACIYGSDGTQLWCTG